MAPPLPKKSVRRILVIHTAFLGDLVLSTPFFAALRFLFPEAEIHFLTTSGGAALFTPNPWGVLPRVFHKRGQDSGPIGLFRVGSELRRLAPEIVFCLHRSIRSSLLAKVCGGESWGFLEGSGSFLFDHRIPRSTEIFEAQKNLRLLDSFAEKNFFSPYPKLECTAEDQMEAQRLLGDRKDFIVLAPSSVWATKRWPAERYGKLALKVWDRFSLPSVIVGGPEDRAVASQVVQEASSKEEIITNLAGFTSIGTLKAILSRAKLVVTNDSSPLHISIAMGTKVVGIYGPTTRDLGFFPLSPEGFSAVSELDGLSCRPCGTHGHRVCPLGHFRCMLDLGVDQVFDEVRKMLCP